VVYQFGGIESDGGDAASSFKDQQRFSAGAGMSWSLSSPGAIKTAKAFERETLIEAARRLNDVRAGVVRFSEDSRMYRELISQSDKQLAAARQAHRLVQANFGKGTMTILDLLQSHDGLTRARLAYAEAVVHCNASQVNLLASLGLINEDKLTAPAT
jgi:outer membrane protein TolC